MYTVYFVLLYSIAKLVPTHIVCLQYVWEEIYRCTAFHYAYYSLCVRGNVPLYSILLCILSIVCNCPIVIHTQCIVYIIVCIIEVSIIPLEGYNHTLYCILLQYTCHSVIIMLVYQLWPIS